MCCRYCSQRQQFGPPDSPEVAVLDYQSTQHRLMPVLATAYALTFAKGVLVDKYCDMKRTKGSRQADPNTALHCTDGGKGGPRCERLQTVWRGVRSLQAVKLSAPGRGPGVSVGSI